MKHLYIITNLDKEYVQEIRIFAKAYLKVKGAKCLLYHAPERTGGGAHIDGTQVPGDTECVIAIGGDGTLIQIARDLAGCNILMLGVDRGHPGYFNQVSRQEDIILVLESLPDERYQLERRTTIHGTARRKEKILLKDIALNEIAITRKDPLKVLRYNVYVNDKYLNEYAIGGVLVATSTSSMMYNLSVGGPIIAPGTKMMVLTPIYSHSLNARSIMLAPEDRARIKVLNSGQVVSFDEGTSMELKAGGCTDIRCSEPQTVMIKLKQILFIQNLSNHLGGL